MKASSHFTKSLRNSTWEHRSLLLLETHERSVGLVTIVAFANSAASTDWRQWNRSAKLRRLSSEPFTIRSNKQITGTQHTISLTAVIISARLSSVMSRQGGLSDVARKRAAGARLKSTCWFESSNDYHPSVKQHHGHFIRRDVHVIKRLKLSRWCFLIRRLCADKQVRLWVQRANRNRPFFVFVKLRERWFCSVRRHFWIDQRAPYPKKTLCFERWTQFADNVQHVFKRLTLLSLSSPYYKRAGVSLWSWHWNHGLGWHPISCYGFSRPDWQAITLWPMCSQCAPHLMAYFFVMAQDRH